MIFRCIFLFITVTLFTCKPSENQPATFKGDWQLGPFTKVDDSNPILEPDSTLTFLCPLSKTEVKWASRNVLNPAAVVKDGKVYLFFRAQDRQGTSRIGMAESTDGIHFKIREQPVLYPDDDEMASFEWSYIKKENPACNNCFDGAEDPRIVETEGGKYLMTYTVYDGKTARLAMAMSSDLITWKKYGLVLKDEKYKNIWSKSGAIVTGLEGNSVVAQKVGGKYWMYFGDTDLFMATSNDLIHWTVLESDETNKMISVLHPRPGYFDSRLVEPGPYALIRPQGIVLIYNSSNAANFGDPSLPKFTYAAGQALYDSNNPTKLTERSKEWFIKPDKDYEKYGEVNEVCFVEGLVFFKNQWFLYYGTADSKIAVAVTK